MATSLRRMAMATRPSCSAVPIYFSPDPEELF